MAGERHRPRGDTRLSAAAGGKVVVAGRDGEKLAKAYADDAGVSAETVDLTDEAERRRAGRATGRRGPRGVDGVGAGQGHRQRSDHDTVLRSFDTKVLGPILLAKYFGADDVAGRFVRVLLRCDRAQAGGRHARGRRHQRRGRRGDAARSRSNSRRSA